MHSTDGSLLSGSGYLHEMRLVQKRPRNLHCRMETFDGRLRSRNTPEHRNESFPLSGQGKGMSPSYTARFHAEETNAEFLTIQKFHFHARSRVHIFHCVNQGQSIKASQTTSSDKVTSRCLSSRISISWCGAQFVRCTACLWKRRQGAVFVRK